MPFSLNFRGLTLLLLAIAEVTAFSQTRQLDNRPRNCSVSGRVMINGQPAANVPVSIFEVPLDWNSPSQVRQNADGSISRSSFKVRTDAEGRYLANNLPPGRYVIRPASGAFVAAETSQQNNEPKMVTLDAGESLEKNDFSLVRGGVITGQVTDSEGRPVVAHSVRLFQVTIEPSGQRRIQNSGGEYGERMTDDRGIYRIYGLSAGNYTVGAGGEGDFLATSKYPPTFYPDASSEQQAKIIEVKPGNEVTGINLRLGAEGKRFEAIGRVVEADTGNPVPNVQVSSNKVYNNQEANEPNNDGGNSYAQADRQGNFRLTGLKRGKYKTSIFASWQEKTDFYAEPMTFDVIDGDVSGVEIKAIRGGVLAGTSIIEGSNDPTAKSKLAQVSFYAQTEVDGQSLLSDQPTSYHQNLLNPDGTFLITGVAPGKIRIGAQSTRDRALNLSRIERGGVEIKDFLELGKGEKITDLRLVFSTGSGVIHGLVQVVGGQRLEGTSYIQAHIVGNTASRGFGTQLDDKGRFELTNLPSGEYELQFNSFSRSPTGDYQMRTLVKQRVTVANGAEVRVTLTYDPNRKEQEEQ